MHLKVKAASDKKIPRRIWSFFRIKKKLKNLLGRHVPGLHKICLAPRNAGKYSIYVSEMIIKKL